MKRKKSPLASSHLNNKSLTLLHRLEPLYLDSYNSLSEILHPWFSCPLSPALMLSAIIWSLLSQFTSAGFRFFFSKMVALKLYHSFILKIQSLSRIFRLAFSLKHTDSRIIKSWDVILPVMGSCHKVFKRMWLDHVCFVQEPFDQHSGE